MRFLIFGDAMEEVKLLPCRFDKNLINQRHIVYEPPMPELAARLPGKSAGRAHTFPLYFPQLLLRLQADTVGNHRDKLGICRLALAGVDRVAEHLVHRLGSAARPRNLNCVADCPFNT